MNVKYNSALNLEHFSNLVFCQELRAIYQHVALDDPTYPRGREIAKAWEVTQAVRGLRDFGAIRSDAEILGVAAGFEHTIFYLTNFVRRVFATDLYATNNLWREADSRMLSNPGALAEPGVWWEPRRLIVQHMDALDLKYEDETFDGLFSSGSIEHFGSLENVTAAVREMGRVLKPGGVLVLASEFRLNGHDNEIGLPGTILFTPDMLMSEIVKPSGLHLVDVPDFSVSWSTVQEAYPVDEAVTKGIHPRSIALTHDDWMWTSISVCLRK